MNHDERVVRGLLHVELTHIGARSNRRRERRQRIFRKMSAGSPMRDVQNSMDFSRPLRHSFKQTMRDGASQIAAEKILTAP